jgi:hypothetical protein
MIQGFSGGLLNRQLIYQTDLPSFQRDFASLKTLDHGTGPNITFTRASDATYFDADGVLQTAGTDVPRFDHDPAAGALSRGLLIEEARTNLMERSAEFDNAYWNKAGTTVTANSATAPDGTTTADTLSSSNDTATMAINNTPQVAYAAGTYTWSLFVKTNGWQWVQLRCSANLSNGRANFDVVNGVVGGTAQATSSITNVGNGWFRIAATFTAAAATGDWALNLVSATDSTRNSTTTGDGVDGIYLWGAQLEAGAFATSYIPTTTAAATRAADSAVVTPISSFYNASEGTLFAEFSRPQTANVANFLQIAGASPNQIALETNGTVPGTVQRFLVETTAGAQANIGFTSALANTVYRLIGGYKTDSFQAAQNGSAGTEDTSGALPTVSQMVIGSGLYTSGGPFKFLNGHIRKIAYWPKRLTNTLLEQLTT